MFNWLFRKRLSPEARRKLLIAAARSEEAVIETHVRNALELLEDLGGETGFDRGIDLYLEVMGLQEPIASTVSNRVLARLESGSPRGVVVRGRRFDNVYQADRPQPGPRRRR